MDDSSSRRLAIDSNIFHLFEIYKVRVENGVVLGKQRREDSTIFGIYKDGVGKQV